MSTEYIERGALMDEIRRHIETIGANAERLVARFPAADVEPVVHARWTISEYEFLDCSACGDSYYTGAESTDQAQSYLNSGDYYKHCPNCGARMDLEEGK